MIFEKGFHIITSPLLFMYCFVPFTVMNKVLQVNSIKLLTLLILMRLEGAEMLNVI